MMLRFATAVVAVTAVWCACGTSGGGPSGAGPAGVVVEVSGTVVAVRASDGSERPLGVEAIVYADDTVTTGTAGFVKIRLDHNGAVLALSDNKKRVLRDSAAWKAKDGSGDLFEDGDDDRTAIAGGQGERAGADTAETVRNVNTTGDDDDDDGYFDTKSGDDDDDERKSEDKQGGKKSDKKDPKGGEAKQDKKDPKGDGAKHDKTDPKDPIGGNGSTCPDEVGCLLADKPPACCSKYGAGGAKKPNNSKGPPSTPTRAEIVKVVRGIMSKVRACGGAGTARVRFVIDPDGHVSKVDMPDVEQPEVVDCIAALIRSLVFPKSSKGTTVNHVFKLAD